MSGSASKSEKFKAAFGFVSANVLADKKKQVGKVLDDLDDALKDLEDATQERQKAYHPGKKGVAENYKPMRTRFDAVATSGLDEKKAFAEYDAIETQAKAALKSVPALKIGEAKLEDMKKLSDKDIDKLVADLGNKVTTPEAQGTLIAAIKARFDIDELGGELTSNALPRLYKALKLVPDNHTKNNPMLQVITRSKLLDTSLYGGGVININAGEAGPFSHDTDKYTDGAGKKLKFNTFDAHTLHEVGHSVDDAVGYMAKHSKEASFGGWAELSEGAVVEALVAEFGADWQEFGPQALRLVAASAIKNGNIQDAINKLQTLKGSYSGLTREILLADPGVKAADDELEKILDEFDLPLDNNARFQVNSRMALNKIGAMVTVPDKNFGFVTQFLMDMQAYLVRAEDLAKQYEDALAAADQPKKLARLGADLTKWAATVTKELWFKSSGDVQKSALSGKVYQRDGTKWWRYDLSARDQMVKNYQFRSPAEWFAEVYTVAMLGKLSPSHPCAKDIKTLDTSVKLT